MLQDCWNESVTIHYQLQHKASQAAAPSARIDHCLISSSAAFLEIRQFLYSPKKSNYLHNFHGTLLNQLSTLLNTAQPTLSRVSQTKSQNLKT